MHSLLTAFAAAALIAISGQAFAQAQPDHQQHHPGGSPTQAQPAPAPAQPPAAAPSQGQMPMGQMMQGMPEHCRTMMQNMPQACMGMMHQMGRMGQGGMMQGHMGKQGGMTPSALEATKAYLDAAHKMHEPMLQGLQASDPDVAFVRGMIAHHRGAIEMAAVRLQYGKHEQTRKWADDVIREQQREIQEMEDWLKKTGN